MSGIYGFTLHASAEASKEQTLGGLQYWNRIYGSQAHAQQSWDDSGIGCHVEHFSDKYPHGAPILEADGCFAVMDALLYNRAELLNALELAQDAPLSDEELLLRWVRVRGWKALKDVNGDFAGAVYDPKSREWTLFRDHLGVRPLYIYRDRQRFAFSTDIRGLLSIPDVDASPNEMRIYKDIIGQNFLSLLETEYAHICFARPAAVTHIRAVSSGFELREQVYWKLRSRRVRLGSDEAYQKEMRRLITDAVRCRLDAFPGLIGAELSGGLDSGVIDILINRLGREARFISWSPSPDVLPLREGEDERHVINDICAQEGIDCGYLHASDKLDMEGILGLAVPPNYDTANLGFGAAVLNKQGARVVFTGHGGDEGVSHRCNRLEPLFYGEFGSFFMLYWKELEGVRLRWLKVFKAMFKDVRRLFQKVRNPASEEELNHPIFAPDFRRRMKAAYRDRLMTFAFDPLKYVMQGGTQHRLDNAAYQGAFNGVRYVYPYLDHRVIDYALSIPRVQYLGTPNRRIFREAFRDMLPASLYDLRYKDFASKRDIPRQDNFHEAFRREIDWILEKLDPNIWSSILDLDYIAGISPSDEHNSVEDFNISRKVNLIKKMVMIQNAREKALKWREFDERNILL